MYGYQSEECVDILGLKGLTKTVSGKKKYLQYLLLVKSS